MTNLFSNLLMKFMGAILLIITLSGLNKTFAQTRVSLNYQHANFEQVLNDIKKQTVYRFVYRSDQLPAQPIAVHVKNEEALTVLGNLLKGTNYSFHIVNGTLIAISSLSDTSTTLQIKGVVLIKIKRRCRGHP
jgi:hypothetical protein